MLKQRLAASRRNLLIVASIAALTVAFPATASAATVYHSTVSGNNATAYFYSFDGCTETSASLFANNGKIKDSVTGHSGTSTVVLNVSRFDYCTGETFAGNTYVELAPGQFTVDKTLATAKLTTTVPLFDQAGQPIGDVTVDITWTATSGATSGKSSSSTTFPDGSKQSFRSTGTFRQASASGSISAGNLNFASGPSYYADIQSSKQGTLTITK
jgi:hypothetical protein